MHLLSINIIIEFTCFLIAAIYLAKDKSISWKLCIPYLLLTVITEITARYLGVVLHLNNGWVYNILTFFEIAITHLMLYDFIRKLSSNTKIFVPISASICYILFVFELFIFNTQGYFTLTTNVLGINLVILSLYYYYLLIQAPEILVIKKHPQFWFVAGLLLFYFGGTIVNLFYGKFSFVVFGTKTLRVLIYHLLIAILYSFWSYSFICRQQNRKLQS